MQLLMWLSNDRAEKLRIKVSWQTGGMPSVFYVQSVWRMRKHPIGCWPFVLNKNTETSYETGGQAGQVGRVSGVFQQRRRKVDRRYHPAAMTSPS